MLYNMTARVALMLGEGTTLADACEWVLRRLPDNLRQYYRMAVTAILVREGLV